MAEVPWLGLLLAFISAIVTNAAYSLEHDAAASLPPLSPRRPLRSATVLLRDRRWVLAFITESAGWLIYVAGCGWLRWHLSRPSWRPASPSWRSPLRTATRPG